MQNKELFKAAKIANKRLVSDTIRKLIGNEDFYLIERYPKKIENYLLALGIRIENIMDEETFPLGSIGSLSVYQDEKLLESFDYDLSTKISDIYQDL